MKASLGFCLRHLTLLRALTAVTQNLENTNL
jgi:hypothetical protein